FGIVLQWLEQALLEMRKRTVRVDLDASSQRVPLEQRRIGRRGSQAKIEQRRLSEPVFRDAHLQRVQHDAGQKKLRIGGCSEPARQVRELGGPCFDGARRRWRINEVPLRFRKPNELPDRRCALILLAHAWSPACTRKRFAQHVERYLFGRARI